MRVFLVFSLLICGAVPASADFMDRMRAHQQLGYARAAVKACTKLKINPSGVLEIIKTLDAADQAAVASGDMMTAHQQSESAKLFAMLGDAACDAALDFETKLKIDLFSSK